MLTKIVRPTVVVRSRLFNRSVCCRTLRHTHFNLNTTFPVAAFSNGRPIVLGCGSNVVDKFFRVRALPRPGEKGYFESPTKIVEGSVVGGVTVNHLAWAKILGVPTGLLALQGNDSSGQQIRKKMEDMGVLTNLIEVNDEYTTAESYVLLQTDGERSIIMASGATSLIDSTVANRMSHHFQTVCKNSIFSTEISQVPLDGVLTLLEKAKAADNLTILDVDVPPSVAFDEAKLGTIDELKKCIELADVLKPSHIAAEELIQILTGSEPDPNSSMEEMTKILLEASGAQMVALTSGNEGCVIACANHVVTEPSFKINSVIDATGAGDGFLGGLIAGIYSMLQNDIKISMLTEDNLQHLARLANAAGAACCRVLGGLPDGQTSLNLMIGFEPRISDLIDSNPIHTETQIEEGAFTSIESDVASATHFADSINITTVTTVASLLRTTTKNGGRVFITGVGKSGYVGQRLAASLSSISVPSQFIHASEWAHGDLGILSTKNNTMNDKQDVIIVLSHSGNTIECIQALEIIKNRACVEVVAVVSNPNSTLALFSSHQLLYELAPSSSEPLGGVPTTSVVLQEMVSNTIIREIIAQENLATDEIGGMNSIFAANHPGGSIGEKIKSE